MSWDGETAAWWRAEVTTDAAYARDVDPLLEALVPPTSDGPVIDFGCGDGRAAHRADVGVDSSLDLLRSTPPGTAVVAGDVTDLPLADASVSGGYAVLVLEHLADPVPFFAEAGRVIAPGGWLVVIANHPLWTPPDAGPFMDPADGEVLWRWGEYLGRSHSDESIPGGRTVRFHHRPLGDLLTCAADAGWSLDRLEERPIGHGDDPLLAAQTQIPRLLGGRWVH